MCMWSLKKLKLINTVISNYLLIIIMIIIKNNKNEIKISRMHYL